MIVVIGRTHRPCGACGALVDIVEGCEHMRVKRVRWKTPTPMTAVNRAAAMVDRAKLLAALGYPKP